MQFRCSRIYTHIPAFSTIDMRAYPPPMTGFRHEMYIFALTASGNAQDFHLIPSVSFLKSGTKAQHSLFIFYL